MADMQMEQARSFAISDLKYRVTHGLSVDDNLTVYAMFELLGVEPTQL